MRDFDGVAKYARYGTFKIGGETEKFKLTVANMSGDAGRY